MSFLSDHVKVIPVTVPPPSHRNCDHGNDYCSVSKNGTFTDFDDSPYTDDERAAIRKMVAERAAALEQLDEMLG